MHTPQQRQGGPRYSPGVLIGGAFGGSLGFARATASGGLALGAASKGCAAAECQQHKPPLTTGFFEDDEQQRSSLKAFLARTSAGALKSTRCDIQTDG